VAAEHWHPLPARAPPRVEPTSSSIVPLAAVQACRSSSAPPAINLPPLTTVAGLSAHFALQAHRAANRDTFVLQEEAANPPPPQRRPPQLRTHAAASEGASAAPAAESAAPAGATGQHSDRQAPRHLRQDLDSDNDNADAQREELRAAGVADAAAPAWGAAGPAPGAASVVAAPVPTVPIFEQTGIRDLVNAPAFEAALPCSGAFIRIRFWQSCDTCSRFCCNAATVRWCRSSCATSTGRRETEHSQSRMKPSWPFAVASPSEHRTDVQPAGHGSHDWKPRRKLKSKLTNDPQSIRNPSGWLKTACMEAVKPDPPASTQGFISPNYPALRGRCQMGDDRQIAWQPASAGSGDRWRANSWEPFDHRIWQQQREVDNAGARGDSRGGNSSSHWGNGGGWNNGAGRDLYPGGSDGWPRGSGETTQYW